VRGGIKQIISFTPEKYKTPFFDEFYLITPLKKLALLKIRKELYDEIQFDHSASIHLSPHAKFVFDIEIGGRQMKFDGSTWLADM